MKILAKGSAVTKFTCASIFGIKKLVKLYNRSPNSITAHRWEVSCSSRTQGEGNLTDVPLMVLLLPGQCEMCPLRDQRNWLHTPSVQL